MDTAPDDELLELLDELLLDDELDELLLELLDDELVDELLLEVEDELLLEELPEEVVPPQLISTALTEARQIPRRVCRLNMSCPLFIYMSSGTLCLCPDNDKPEPRKIQGIVSKT